MKKEIKIFTKLHKSTKRDYLGRMFNNKVESMKRAKKFEYDYWDGHRNHGYGGYKYIPGKWTPAAKALIKKYKLNKKSKVLDVGCGKGFLLYEIKKLIPEINVSGFDISRHGIKNAKEEIRNKLYYHDARKKFPIKRNHYDLVFSFNTLHNFRLPDLIYSIKEIERVSKNAFILVEGYRNELELFNLQCWALTAESFFTNEEWKYLFKLAGYKGDFEFIYF
tara:strand:+ start:941 stop:1603 length:663 start_codon:yes stop_codon:yes gene_type:complete